MDDAESREGIVAERASVSPLKGGNSILERAGNSV
jgi:hypothetical protein